MQSKNNSHKKSGKGKNNFRNISMLLLVMGVVAVSGCIANFGGSGGSAFLGSGIEITDFSSSVSDVSDCDKSVRLSLDMENKGGKSIAAKEVLGCLIGKNFPGTTTQQMWSIDAGTQVCQLIEKKIDAPDPLRNIPGGAASFKWTAYSPFVPFPLVRDDGFTGRIFYKYSSRTSATVYVVSEGELATMKQTGKSPPTSAEIDKTASPVDIAIDVNQPIVGANGDTFTLKVTLTNVGGGTVFGDPSTTIFAAGNSVPLVSEDSLNKITIVVDTPLDAGTTAGYCKTDLSNVELRKGSTVIIPCDIKINKPITSLQSYPILLTASYGYFVDSSQVPIQVGGKKNQVNTACLK
jgi:hypothetical protein